jgi:hypothetical protein
MIKQRVINEEVLRSMEVNSQRSLGLIVKHLPEVWLPLGRDFAGVHGSRTHTALESGQMSYRSYLFTKG